MNTTTAERPKAATQKTKADAIRAARAALGDDAIEGLDFKVENTGAGWAFAEIGDAPPAPAPQTATTEPIEAVHSGDANHFVLNEAGQKAVAAAKPPRGKAKANVEAPARPKTKTGGSGSKPPRKPPTAPATAPRAKAARKARAPKRVAVAKEQRTFKSETMIGLLSRPEGATLPQLQDATGWLPHSIRAYVTAGLKKKGLTVVSAVEGEGESRARVYRIPTEAPEAI